MICEFYAFRTLALTHMINAYAKPVFVFKAKDSATMLPKRTLGRQGLEVSAIGLGCMGMSHTYGMRSNLRVALCV